MANHRVLLDGYYIGRHSGFGRYVHELCQAMGNSLSDIELLVAVPGNVDDSLLTPFPSLSYHRMANVSFPLWEQILIPLCAFSMRCDLVHFPYNTKSILISGRRSVVTVHDLIFFLEHPERDLKSLLYHAYARAVFNLSTRKADTVVAVSDTTQTALAQRGISSTTVYNSVDTLLALKKRLRPGASPERPFFLHRGSYFAGHRNTDRIIRAFLGQPELTTRFDLKILGVPDGAAFWNMSPEQPVHFCGSVTDDELASMYAESSGVLAVSILEGFCLPIIEAFGFGAPVVTSSINPMMEIAGDAAILVDPFNEGEIARAMLALARRDSLARTLVDKGHRRLQAFDGAAMAAKIRSLYERAMIEEIVGAAPQSR
jgi:glycosyltransferase involved in cell wall biosynthesis